jgi:heme oxygenase
MPDLAFATRSTTRAARNPSPTAPSLRNFLRDATAADHARLDAQLGSFDLHELAGYRRFLEANAAALLPLEGALAAGGVRQILPGWERHARSRAILSDLAALGGTPRPLDPPVLNGSAALLGTLYVLEGSRLGAAYLLRHVRRAGDPRIPWATAYLAHGEGGRLWQAYLTVLEGHSNSGLDSRDLIESARRAFALFSAAAVQP